MHFFTSNLTLLATSLKKVTNYLLKDFNELTYLSLSKNSNDSFALNSFKFIESKIKEDIAKIKPDYSFILSNGEIIENKDKSNYIVLSNIGGFNNFKKGLPFFTISLALIRDNQEFAAVVYYPLTETYFMAEKNKGAFLNKYRLKNLHNNPGTHLLTIATNSPLELPKLLQNCKFFSTQNPALDLCYLSSLKIDLCYNNKNTTFNYLEILPSLMIGKEAGLHITYVKNENKINNLIAGNPLLREELKL